MQIGAYYFGRIKELRGETPSGKEIQAKAMFYMNMKNDHTETFLDTFHISSDVDHLTYRTSRCVKGARQLNGKLILAKSVRYTTG